MSVTPSRRLRTRLLFILVNLVSLGCLVWTLRDVRLGEFKDDLATMDWKWVAIAVVADICVYFWHGLRWNLLLRPLVQVKYWTIVRAIYIGLFVNEVLPFRAGEVLRCYLITRWTGLPISVSITSALIERIFDGIWLCLCLLLTLHYVPFPRQLRFLVDGGYVLGMVVLAGVVVLAIAMFYHRRGPPSPQPQTGWRRQLTVLMDDLGLIGHSRYLYFALFQSLPYLLLQVIPIWAAFKAFGFDFSIAAAFVLMVILRVGAVAPLAPGNLGLFQLLTKECVQRILGADPADAARFSLVLWGIVTLPLLIGGFVALSIEEAGLLHLKRAAEEEAAGMRSPKTVHPNSP